MMAAESDRLQRMYGQMSEEHLLNLAEEPDDLTVDAREALTAELQRRGLLPGSGLEHEEHVEREGVGGEAGTDEERAYAFGAGIPGVVPAGGAAVEMALEPGGEERLGMTALVSLYDGHELSKACEVLEEAGVEFAIEEVAGDASMGTPSRFQIWVLPRHDELSRQVLREKLGLFPLAEVAVDADDPGQEGDLVVAQFDSADEAEQVRSLLVSEGFAAKVESDAEDAATSLVVVPAKEQERALAVVAARLA